MICRYVLVLIVALAPVAARAATSLADSGPGLLPQVVPAADAGADTTISGTAVLTGGESLAVYADGFLQTSDGASIYYQIKDNSVSGYPLILLHGGEYIGTRCRGLSSWDPQFDAFAEHYKVVRLDMRYCGKSSDTGTNPFSWQWLFEAQRATEDVIEVMAHLGIGKGHILGLSIGSAVAAQIAVFYPEKINKLILASPWAGKTLPRNASQLQSLKDIRDKTMMLGADSQYSYELAWAASQSYAPLSVFIENAGHFVNRDQPELFDQEVLGFLADTAPLTVSIAGSGQVHGGDGTIACPGTCTATYPKASQVTLVATPASSYIFNRWSGACTGRKACTVAMTDAKTVTAQFLCSDCFPGRGGWRVILDR